MLSNGTVISTEFTDVFIGNFFVPKVEVIAPNGGENWTSQHNITWTASDVNADDALLFDVLFSDDSGTSFEILIESTNQTWFELADIVGDIRKFMIDYYSSSFISINIFNFF